MFMTPTQFEFPSFFRKMKDLSTGYTYKNGLLVIESPGFGKEDINVEMEENVLHIYGKKELFGEEYSIDRKFTIPHHYLNSDPIKVKVENGIISIQLNRKEKEKSPKIIIS